MMATTLLSLPVDATFLKLTCLIVVVAIIIYFTLFSSISTKETSRYSYFRNSYGEPLGMLPQDTRITRFTHGAELSLQGLQKFPEKPFLVKNGSITELVIFNAAQVRDFYAGDGKDHLKPRDCNFGDYWERMLGDCVGMQNGQTWHISRSCMDPYLAFSQAAARVSDFQLEFKNWATRLCKDPKAAVTTSKTAKSKIGNGNDKESEKKFCIDSVAACRELPFKLIAMALYGNMLTESLYEQLWSLNLMHEEITHSAFLEKWPQMWWYRWLPTKANRVLREYEERWLELNVKVIADAREANVDCVMEKIYRGVEAGDMSMVMFLQSVDEILFTNIDVTSTMFAGSVINLGRNPALQQTLREEIVAQDEADMTAYLRREDTLLHKTYMEVLRINPPAWYSLPEITAKDKRIADYLIPAGTSVTIDCNRLNKLSQVWGTDGNIFRPERFDKLSASQVRYSMHGFGMGPRKCLGKNFANLIIKLLVVTVLREFELAVEGEGEETLVNRESFTRSPEEMVRFRYR